MRILAEGREDFLAHPPLWRTSGNPARFSFFVFWVLRSCWPTQCLMAVSESYNALESLHTCSASHPSMDRFFARSNQAPGLCLICFLTSMRPSDGRFHNDLSKKLHNSPYSPGIAVIVSRPRLSEWHSPEAQGLSLNPALQCSAYPAAFCLLASSHGVTRIGVWSSLFLSHGWELGSSKSSAEGFEARGGMARLAANGPS